jgi:hypothetical protein
VFLVQIVIAWPLPVELNPNKLRLQPAGLPMLMFLVSRVANAARDLSSLAGFAPIWRPDDGRDGLGPHNGPQ